jgi:hypothetical protein
VCAIPCLETLDIYIYCIHNSKAMLYISDIVYLLRSNLVGRTAKYLEVQELSKSIFDGRFFSDRKELEGVLLASMNGFNHSQRKGGGLFVKRNR